MRNKPDTFLKFALLIIVWILWLWIFDHPFSSTINFLLIVGSLLLVYPVVWLGRRLIDKNPTLDTTQRVTAFVHYAVGFLFGVSIIRVIVTQQDWRLGSLPVPPGIGLILVILSGAAFLMTVINLALKGLGAPFAIALSQKLAVDWLYAWTRNPMVLSALALLVSLGIWYQSVLFVAWALLLFAPSLLVFVKVYEERELEIRFGVSYLEYKTRTPFLFPRRPGK